MEKILKSYTIKVIEQNDEIKIHRTNDGFTSVELLGLLEYTQIDIMRQMAGQIRPTVIKRNVIDDNKEKES